MTEAEWLTSDDPARMLAWLCAEPMGVPGGPPPFPAPSARKLRLFAAACCRNVWGQLTDPRGRRAVEMAERFADGLATEGERVSVEAQAWVAGADPSWPWGPTYTAGLTVQVGDLFDAGDVAYQTRRLGCAPAAQAEILRDLFGDPWRPVRVTQMVRKCFRCGAVNEVKLEESRRPTDGKTVGRLICARCPEPHPAVKVEVGPEWLTPTVVGLSQAAYEERAKGRCEACGGKGYHYPLNPIQARGCPSCHGTGRTEAGHLDPARLAVLADALEEAGCSEVELLRHLRGQELCWDCGGTGGFQANSTWVPCDTCDADGNCYTDWSKWSPWVPLRGPHWRGCWVLDTILGLE